MLRIAGRRHDGAQRFLRRRPGRPGDGASRGIGAATAISLAGAGYRVGVNYRTGEAEAAAVVARIRAAGGTAAAIQGDIAREEDVVRLFAEVDRALGPLSALVANAGISGGFGRIDDVTGDTLRAVFETNVYGTFWCCREAVRRLSTAHGGQGGGIVLVSSQAARFGGNRLGPYAASKAAINALTIGLAREVAAEGIRVNAVSPGVIETDQQSDIPADAARRWRRAFRWAGWARPKRSPKPYAGCCRPVRPMSADR